VDVLEVAPDVRHHHMPNREFGGGVTRLKSPFRHRLFLLEGVETRSAETKDASLSI
jgi:hypothetical protein